MVVQAGQGGTLAKTKTSSSRARAPLSPPLPAIQPPSVSAEMVAAGVAVLWGSGAVEGQLGSDKLLVAEIFEAMVSAAT